MTILLREAEEAARRTVQGSVPDFPQVAAWRDAYRRFGAKPADHRSSIEALLRRVIKPDDLPTINNLVDIGNLVSLRHLLPAGVHPLGSGNTTIKLRTARSGDVFVASEGGAGESVPEGEIILASGTNILTRRWTWRQSAATRILPETGCVLFNIDGLLPISHVEVRAAMRDVADLVGQFCGGILVASEVLTADNPQLSVNLDDLSTRSSTDRSPDGAFM
ncbi:MAG: phenylalanine--tRNA ligase beta subunit-related protein [Devosia sp.]